MTDTDLKDRIFDVGTQNDPNIMQHNNTEKNVTDMNMNDVREQMTDEEVFDGAFMEQDALLDELLKEIAQQDARVIAPLEVQAAWRKAIRAEAAAQNEQSKKIIRLNRWMRSAGSIAAALVVLVAGTYGVRMGENAPVSAGDTTNTVGVYSQNAQEENYNQTGYGEREVGMDVRPGGYAVLSSTYLRSDGSTEQKIDLTKPADGQTENAPNAQQTVSESNLNEEESIKGKVTSDTGDALMQIEPVVLRSAERTIHSLEYERDMQWLGDLVSEYDAYYEEKSEIAADEQNGRVSSMTIRVPSEHLDDFLTEMDQLGTTVMTREKAEDVTGRYMDKQSRLKALQLQKDKLSEMMKSAQNVQELIAIDAQMTDVVAEMERMEGDLRRWQSQQSYSTVSVTLREVFEQPLTSEASMGERMKAGFAESVVWLGDFSRDALVVLVSMLPRLVVWVPLAVLAGIVIWAIARKKKQ